MASSEHSIPPPKKRYVLTGFLLHYFWFHLSPAPILFYKEQITPSQFSAQNPRTLNCLGVFVFIIQRRCKDNKTEISYFGKKKIVCILLDWLAALI